MTLEQAKTEAMDYGMTLVHRGGEYRVNFRGGTEATAYYTNDRDDAVATAKAMRRRAGAEPIPAPCRID